MSRRRGTKSATRVVTVFLDEAMVFQLDQYQNSFGLETRAIAASALMKAGMSAVPLDTFIFEVCQAAVKEHRKFFTEKQIEFFEQQLHELRGTRG